MSIRLHLRDSQDACKEQNCKQPIPIKTRKKRKSFTEISRFPHCFLKISWKRWFGCGVLWLVLVRLVLFFCYFLFTKLFFPCVLHRLFLYYTVWTPFIVFQFVDHFQMGKGGSCLSKIFHCNRNSAGSIVLVHRNLEIISLNNYIFHFIWFGWMECPL